MMLGAKYKQIAVTGITPDTKKFLDTTGVKYVYIADAELKEYKKQFNWVVATDEYFTFANTDQQQQDQIGLFCSLARDFVISTLKDYKNQDYKDREYSQPVLVRNGADKKTYLESHDWDLKDRSTWKTSVFEIDQTTNALDNYGPFNRRTMYFKQLAKFSLDAGANNFLVHKNLMYKSLVKRNYEHVISITFDGQ
jgi:hypothetical protein